MPEIFHRVNNYVWDTGTEEWVKMTQPGGGSGTPGGSDTNIQFNDSGSFGGSDDLNWDGVALTLNATAAASDARLYWDTYPMYFVQQVGVKTPGFVGYVFSSTATDASGFFPMRSRGTAASPTEVQSGDNLGVVEPSGWDGSDFAVGSSFRLLATEHYGASNHGTKAQLRLTSNGGSIQDTVYDFGQTLFAIPAAFSATAANNTTIATMTGGSITGSGTTPFWSMTGTWNTTGAPTAFKVNVTNTASNSASKLFDFQVDGNSHVSYTAATGSGAGQLNIGRGTGTFITRVSVGANDLVLVSGNSDTAYVRGGLGINVGTGGYTFGTTVASSSPDLLLLRDAADTLAQYRSTNAQAYRLYNTRTNASNGEWATLNWASNIFHIGATKNGTGTARALQIDYGGTTTAAISVPATSGAVTVGGNTLSSCLIDMLPSIANTRAIRCGGGGYIDGLNFSGNSSTPQFAITTNKAQVQSGTVFSWSSTTDANAGTPDSGFARNVARKIEINNGTAGTFGDLIVRQYYADQTITAGGTTGDQTINKSAGTVNIAAAATSVTVTNSLCTTSSTVYAAVRTNDTTAYIKNVVPGSGSFVITLGAAATAETSIGFLVIN